MKVLVTGGAGYVGSMITTQLVSNGYKVRVLDNLMDKTRKRPSLSQEEVEFVKGDVRDKPTVQRATQGCDVVLHLAAIVGYPACDASPRDARSVNVDGTRTVVACAESRPLVVLSTMSCLGLVNGGVCDERTVPKPVSLYGKTKYEAEQHALAEGKNTVVLRPASAFGRALNMRYDLLVHHLLKEALTTGRIVVYEPESMRCLVHVRELAKAVQVGILEFEKMVGQIFHVGSDSLNVSKIEIARAIQSVTSCEIVADSTSTDPEMRNYAGMFTKFSQLGFRATLDLDAEILALARDMKQRSSIPDEASSAEKT